MSNALVPVQDVERMAMAVAKSGLFGFKSVDQAMAIMLIAQAEGLHPAIAARDYHVIQGRPTLKSDAMLSRFLQSGGKVEWTSYTDDKVAAKFTHPQGGSIEVDWTPQRAKKAGIGNDMHNKYPRQMLRARCISEGVRTVFPGCTSGMYAPEEVETAAPGSPEKPAPKDMGNAEIVVELADVTRRINAARTVEELEAIRPDIRRLRGEDKQTALATAKYRGEQIRATQTATDADPETGEINPPHVEETI